MTVNRPHALQSPRGARLRRGIALIALVPTALASFGAQVALADNVTNNVVVGGNDTTTVGSSTKVSYQILQTKDSGESGTNGQCNVKNSTPATVSIAGTAVGGVTPTITPASLTFKACDVPQEVTFSAAKAGNYPITVTISPSTNYNVSAANFTLKVTGNTAPTISVVGPVASSSYEKGSVPAASCNVVDREDGNSTKTAALSTISGPLTSYGLGSQTASCSYTDAGGLTANAAVTYSIVDTTAPVLTVPGDITKEATSSSGATASWTVSATDAVDSAPATSCTPASGSTFPKGTTAVTCTATDVARNQDTKIFNVLVQDTTKPVLSLPADITLEATSGAGAVGTYTATAADTVDGPLTPSCVPTSGSTFALGATPVNCSVSDLSNNRSEGGFSITVRDTTAPELTVPADIRTEATGPSGAQVTYSTSAVDLVDGPVAPVCSKASNATFGLGTTTVSCTATDVRGNAVNKSFVVSVVDTTKPDLNLPSDITQEATSASGADVAYSATATDLVSGSVTTFCSPLTGSTFSLSTTTVSCSATDGAGNQRTGSFNVKVQDTTGPALSNKPADRILEATSGAGAVASYVAPTATDAVDASPVVTCVPASGGTFALGSTPVSCTAADGAGNKSAAHTFLITVQDTVAPVVTVPADQTVEATGPNGATASWTGVSATDTVDGPVDATCDKASGAQFPLGSTQVTCSATDAAGNPGNNSFTITVQDKGAPVVTVPGNMTEEATGPSGAEVRWIGVSAEDTVDGSVPATCSPASGSTFGIATTTVTCSATDNAKNTGSNAFTVTVRDTTKPTVTVPSQPIVVEATSKDGAAATWAASATDLVDVRLTPTCSPASGAVLGLGQHTVTCTATDTAGNTGTASFTVKVLDTTAPAITVPTSLTAEATSASGAIVNYQASATDLVDGATDVVCTPANGSTFALGSTEVTCDTTDAAGNKASRTFTVAVLDRTAPTVDALGDLTLKASSAAGAVATYTATASDIVDGTIAATCAPASGNTFAVGVTTVSCTARDAAGNISAPATFKVTVGFDKTAFLAPVDGNKVLNGMKGGSTAPLKWQISDGRGGWISDLSVVKSVTSTLVNCSTGASVDDLAITATGGTVLRYDSTANQFIYNWQSPKKPGTCYTLSANLTDGTSITALFQLR